MNIFVHLLKYTYKMNFYKRNIWIKRYMHFIFSHKLHIALQKHLTHVYSHHSMSAISSFTFHFLCLLNAKPNLALFFLLKGEFYVHLSFFKKSHNLKVFFIFGDLEYILYCSLVPLIYNFSLDA